MASLQNWARLSRQLLSRPHLCCLYSATRWKLTGSFRVGPFLPYRRHHDHGYQQLCFPRVPACRYLSTACTEHSGSASIVRPDSQQGLPLPLEQVRSQTSVEGLLQVVESLSPEAETLTPHILSQLVTLQYKKLYDTMPCLYRSIRVAFHQLGLHQMTDAMQPIRDNPAFQRMLQALESRTGAFPLPMPILDQQYYNFGQQNGNEHHGKVATSVGLDVTDLPTIYKNLALLGLASTKPVMRSLLLYCLSNVHQLGYESMADFVLYMPSAVRRTGMRYYLPSLKALVSNSPVKNDSELTAFAEILKKATFYMSLPEKMYFISELHRAADELLDNMNDPDRLCTLVTVGIHLAFFSSSMVTKEEEQLACDIVRKANSKVLQMVSKLEPYHLGELAHSLKLAGQYTYEIGKVLENRAADLLTLLGDDLRLPDIASLISALTSRSPRDLLQMLESAALPKLLQEDIDTLMLTNMARIVSFSSSTNYDIIHCLQSLTVKHMDNIAGFSSHLYPIVHFISKFPFHKVEHAKIFNECLVQLVYRHIPGSRVYLQTTAAQLLMSSTDTELPERLFELTMNSMPTLRVHSLHRLMMGLQQAMKRPATEEKQEQLLKLQYKLFNELATKLDKIHRTDILVRQAHMLLFQNEFYDPTLIDGIMSLFTKFSKKLSVLDFLKVTRLFKISAYFMPEVYDNLTAYAVQELKPYNFFYVAILLEALARVGYIPKEFPGLVEHILKMVDLGHSKNRFYELSILHSLAQLQCFPEEKLSEAFSLEYVQGLEATISEHPHYKAKIEKVLMELNRAVVLECPQLDVPWFTGGYCAKHAVSSPPDPYRLWMLRDLQESVEKAMGGPEYVGSSISVQYGYMLNFECLLTKDNKPVVYQKTNIDPDIQRVAIILRRRTDYLYNVRTLKGMLLQQQRHLEIMGYKVVDVCYFDWHSMSLQGKEAKTEFLANKIFH